jgi:hypothetical protein
MESVSFATLTESTVGPIRQQQPQHSGAVFESVIEPLVPSRPEPAPQPKPTATVTEPAPQPAVEPAKVNLVPSDPPLAIDKNGYVVVAVPEHLQLLLKKGFPSAAHGISAGGILIDKSPLGTFALNPRGFLRYGTTKQEELVKIEDEKRRAADREDFALAAHLLERQREIETSQEPLSVRFVLAENLVLCFRKNEWMLLRSYEPIRRPELKPQDDSWTLAALPGALSKLWSQAQETVPRVFNETVPRVLTEVPRVFTELLESEPIPPPPPPSATIATGTPTTPPTVTIQGPMDRLASVEKAVSEILAFFGTAKTAEERQQLGDDRSTREIAVLVRVKLCSALAQFFLDGFKTERFLLPPYHIWDWIESYSVRFRGAVPNIAAFSLKKGIDNANGLFADKSMRFRGLVCYALNARLLDTWVGILVGDAAGLAKFFTEGATVRNKPATRHLVDALKKLQDESFLLSLNFESTTASKQQQP